MAQQQSRSENIAVIGLGYVGLPVALAFGRKYPTFGFDINAKRVDALSSGRDDTGEVSVEELRSSRLRFTTKLDDLRGTTFFVVAVPTPIDKNYRPDLKPLVSASESVGKVLQKGAVVVYESTVYPGVTEEVCGPVLERVSGLKAGVDFTLGYSPERINPGDREHTFERITKVVSGQDPATLDRVAEAYGAVVTAGVHRATSIRVAEAAKVIENTQRDLNIALMNELALIFDRLGIRTQDVLDAAATKWNFLRFSPGLVGGHCIGVDPYYLTTKAEELGYQPQVILSGRRINNGVGAYVAQRAMKMLSRAGKPLAGAKVGILGLTFKENVPDLRNSRIPDIVNELLEFGIKPLVHDPLGNPEEAHEEYGLVLCDWSALAGLDALIFAVPHRKYLEMGIDNLLSLVRDGGVVVDVKSVLDPARTTARGLSYWSL
ncbi:MAG TPA: nucleotide sugar dehydrogenase [Kofleriaceae bacterium]|nr:nucleotide sugar dehydrogenase [Kofleriaceae bacterium]